MYALILMVFLQHGDCLGCAPDLVSTSTTPGFATLASCQAAAEQAKALARSKYLKTQCVKQG